MKRWTRCGGDEWDAHIYICVVERPDRKSIAAEGERQRKESLRK